MRIFIAIELPEQVKTYLFELQKKIKGVKARWVAKKNLHLTLNFVGEIQEDKVDKIKSILKTIKQDKFQASLSEIGFFPNSNLVKVVWVGLEPRKTILQLAQKIDQELMDFSREQKFESHITLGRLSSFKKKEDFFKSIKEIKIEKLSFNIDSFKLIKSELHKDGPKYTPIENFNLS